MLTVITNTITSDAVAAIDVTIVISLANSTQADGLVTSFVYEMCRGRTLTDVVTTLGIRGKGHLALDIGYTRILEILGHFQAKDVAAISVNDVVVFAITGLLTPAVSVLHAVVVVAALCQSLRWRSAIVALEEILGVKS